MPINFTPQRWEKVARNAQAWWEGRLDRPLVQVYMWGQDPGRPEPALPNRGFTSHYDLAIPAEAIVDRWDYQLCAQKYLGDAFPHTLPNFGPGIVAGFLGCRVHNTDATTWFEPVQEKELPELTFQYDPENIWLRRVKDICAAAMARWGSQVQVGMTDLGGTLDVLASFRPAERLLMDFYDHGARAEELTWQLHKLWWRYFEEIDSVLRRGGNRGYTAWTPLFSEKLYYMLQCDLSYMIGPEMFKRFVLPELAASCRRLGNPAYHLDGPGQIPHVDLLMGIEELKVIQYVPTITARDATQYPDLYRRIRQGGRRIQVFSNYSSVGLKLLDVLAEQLGSANGIAMVAWVGPEQEAETRAILRRYGVEEE
jgi:hypothetical protein